MFVIMEKILNYVMFIFNIDMKKFIKNYSIDLNYVCFLLIIGVNVYFNCNNEEWRLCIDLENFLKRGGGWWWLRDKFVFGRLDGFKV